MSIEQEIADHAKRIGVEENYAAYRQDIEDELKELAAAKLSMALRMKQFSTLALICEDYDSDYEEVFALCSDRHKGYRSLADRRAHSMSGDMFKVYGLLEGDNATCDRLGREFAYWLNYESAIDAEIKHRDEIAAEKEAGI